MCGRLPGWGRVFYVINPSPRIGHSQQCLFSTLPSVVDSPPHITGSPSVKQPSAGYLWIAPQSNLPIANRNPSLQDHHAFCIDQDPDLIFNIMSGFSFGAPAASTAGSSLFGAPAASTAGTGPFGAPAATTAGGGLFGQPAASAAGGGFFGAKTTAPAAGGLFGSAPAQSAAPAAGGIFGAPAASGGGFFGGAQSTAPATGGMFGSAPAAGGFGASTFGAKPATSTGFGGFGASTTAPATGSLFGSAPKPFGQSTGFGASLATPAAPTLPSFASSLASGQRQQYVLGTISNIPPENVDG